MPTPFVLERIDIPELENLGIRGNRIITVTRGAIVSGMNGQTDSNTIQSVLAFLAAPPHDFGIGGEHPRVEYAGMYGVGYELQVLSANILQVVLTYRNTLYHEISGSATLVEYDTDKDRLGDVITVSHAQYTRADGTVIVIPQHLRTQSGVVRATRSELIYTVMRVILQATPGQGVPILGHVLSGINKINSDDNFPEGSGFAGKWRCENITYDDSDLGRAGYAVTYTFRYRAAGWQPEVAWVDPQTQRPGVGLIAEVPGTPDPNAGRKTVNLYAETAFGGTGGLLAWVPTP